MIFLNFFMIVQRILNINFLEYNKNISYLGSWKYNALRTKYKIHKILPFNKWAYLHDKRYYLIFGLKINLIMLLIIKLFVDLIFLKDCVKDSFTFNLLKMSFKLSFALFCFCVVVLMTPIYIFRYRKHK